jgi:hypothetical protein
MTDDPRSEWGEGFFFDSRQSIFKFEDHSLERGPFSPSPLAGEGGGEGKTHRLHVHLNPPHQREENCWLFSWFAGDGVAV